ncbi:MAG: S24/S26 family peptidase [Spirochaetes bacterium]|nr:S24/S26 family peptidase [Spirochaetota bacterium]
MKPHNKKIYSMRYTSFLIIFFSFFIPGIGQVYFGEIARGIFFLCTIAFFALLIPFGLIVESNKPSLLHALTMTVGCFLLHLTCFADTVRLIIAQRKCIEKHVSFLGIIGFALISAAIIFLSVRFVSSFYFLHQIHDDMMQPSFFKGEIVLATNFYKKIEHGDAVIFNDNSTTRIGRIIAREKDMLKPIDGMMELNGAFLSIGILFADEIERRDLQVSDSLFYEVSGNKKYAVQIILKKAKSIPPAKRIQVPPLRCAIAFDNRILERFPRIIECNAVYARIEGIFWGKSWKRFFLPPYDTL